MNPSINSLDKPIPIQGFPRVADKIAQDPDNTSTIFRRFDRLSARNLLFLEAQLAELEARQNKSDEQDLIAASLTTIECHSDWRKFEAYATERNGDGSFTKPEQAAKMELALEIKEKLNEYRKSKYMAPLLFRQPGARAAQSADRLPHATRPTRFVGSRIALSGSPLQKYPQRKHHRQNHQLGVKQNRTSQRDRDSIAVQGSARSPPFPSRQTAQSQFADVIRADSQYKETRPRAN